MLFTFTLGVAIVLGASMAIQLALCAAYVRALRSGQSADEAKVATLGRPPRFCVLMPLRGADPFLKEAIRSVVENPYPNLILEVVIDGPNDPARAVVQDALGDPPRDRCRVSILRERHPERSLLCSSLLQAVDERMSDCDLFSFCAADLILPENWFWHMAAAMADESVGCTLGNRWYQPTDGRWGSLVRQAWNAGATVLMWCFQIPWGGAAALRPADIQRSGLQATWKTSLVEDVPIHDAIRRLGKRLAFVPALTSVNREEVSLPNAFRFLHRQMIWARLYHPRWWLVVGHAASGLLSLVLPAATAIVAATLQQWPALQCAAGTLAAYVVFLTLLWAWLEREVARVVDKEPGCRVPLSWSRLARMLVVIPIVQVLYPVAIARCCLARHIDWRGIRYRFVGRGRVRMVEYVPFTDSQRIPDGKSSVE